LIWVAYFCCVFRNAAQRRFVASIIAFRPAVLSLRFFRASDAREARAAKSYSWLSNGGAWNG
jgi:hypothetical protein